MLKLIYIKGDYLFNPFTIIGLIFVAIINLGIFLISFTYSSYIYSELVMNQQVSRHWKYSSEENTVPDFTLFHYIIFGKTNSKQIHIEKCRMSHSYECF